MNRLAKHRSNTAFYGSSLIIASSLFYGSYGVWTRLMGNSFGPYMQAWIRGVIVILILLLTFFFGRQKWESVRWRKDRWWLILWCLANWMIGAPLYYAINRIGIGLGILIFYSSYLLAMFVLGRLLSGEQYDRAKVCATLLALGGLFLTSAPTFSGTELLPFVAAAAAGCSVGLDMVVAQKVNYGSTQTAILAWATGLVGTIPAAFILHEQVPSFRSVHWLYLFAFVVASTAASWLSIHGVKRIEAGAAGILGLLEIVWALLFGMLFFHERPHMLVYAGAVCIVAAAAIPYLKSAKNNKEVVIEEIPA